MRNTKVKVAFPVYPEGRWGAGQIYQNNLLEALRRCSSEIEIYFFIENSPHAVTQNSEYPIVGYPAWTDNSLVKNANRVGRRLFAFDVLLQMGLRSVRDGGVNVIFSDPTSPCFVGGKTAVLHWIPDFQHVHLPEMFTAGDLRLRNMTFKKEIRRADLILLSSQDALKDFSIFALKYAHKARVNSFVVHIPTTVYRSEPCTVVSDYKLPEKFFYLPNQFWKHKNHRVVLHALKLLREKGIRPFMVFTGSTSDYRNQLHFGEILREISALGLRGQIALLGLVPREHVYLLIRQCICVINPSLFEGWSTTVEEAKSIGKRILLSNLAVHKEQAPSGATYFDPHNAEDLASKLEQIWAQAPPGPDLQLEERARSKLPMRMKRYGKRFVEIAREAAAVARKGK